MLDGKALVIKLLPVNGLAASSIASSKVTALAHELLDDAVEEGTLVMKRLASASYTFFASA